MHDACLAAALAWTRLGRPVLGQTVARPAWRVVRTGGFDLDRPDGTGHRRTRRSGRTPSCPCARSSEARPALARLSG